MKVGEQGWRVGVYMLMRVMCWRVGRSPCGTGYSSSGTNHCLLVSFPLLSELLSRTAPTGRKEQGWRDEGG